MHCCIYSCIERNQPVPPPLQKTDENWRQHVKRLRELKDKHIVSSHVTYHTHLLLRTYMSSRMFVVHIVIQIVRCRVLMVRNARTCTCICTCISTMSSHARRLSTRSTSRAYRPVRRWRRWPTSVCPSRRRRPPCR